SRAVRSFPRFPKTRKGSNTWLGSIFFPRTGIRVVRNRSNRNGGPRAAVPVKSYGGSRSRTGVVQHRHGATILRPARDVVADRDRTLLAVGDGADAIRVDAARNQIVLGVGGATGTQRDVVFPRAALVGMAFD